MHRCHFMHDKTRTHKNPNRVFTICECGKRGQASLANGRRFTTAREHVGEIKKPVGVKAYDKQKEFLREHGFKSVQKFFDHAYLELVSKVHTSAV